jgi:phosphoenolpyruvate carboxykinase (ATP)
LDARVSIMLDFTSYNQEIDVELTVISVSSEGESQVAFTGLQQLHHNLSRARLFELAIQRGEGEVTSAGALCVRTGVHTGRSAQDKFTVRDENTEHTIWWENSKPLARQHFDTLLNDFVSHAQGKELFVEDLYAGADLEHRLKTRVYCEFAWHALFIQHLLIEPEACDLGGFAPDFTIIDLPSFKADPVRHGVRGDTVIAVDFAQRLVLIGGTSYAGEIKKSVFTYLNYVLPAKNVMPMHCSVNDGRPGAAVFFGLSGTGKTTLSADPHRELIGDDEHGWSPEGLYNFEGGCYAKTIKLSAEHEPEIYQAANTWGTVLENVVLDPATREPDFDDESLTENTRAGYPLAYIPNASATGRAGHPRNIIMLTADAFGVLPPIAKLTPSQAMYHFLSGYTAKVAGTEKGISEPQATFSTCFGSPFMPRHPSVYGNLLRRLIGEHGVDCWLVNTGWTGGKYGVGHRMPIKATRALLNAALSGSLHSAAFRRDPIFGFEVPTALDGVDAKLLNPRDTWADKAAYDAQAKILAKMFTDNFRKFEAAVDAEVRSAGPELKAAAE